MEIKTIFEDEREISAIHKSDDYQTNDYAVGKGGVTKIIPYREKGEYDYLTFLAIFRGEDIAVRLPANGLAIFYKRFA